MQTYTAKELTERLQKDDPSLQLRTVRYYTQIGLVPPLTTVGSRRVYTDEHLHYFRAVLSLAKSGEPLAAIQEQLQGKPIEEIARIGSSLPLVQSRPWIGNEVHRIGEDVLLSVGPSVSRELRARMIETVSSMLREENNR
ncbi:hypothetical protein J31TS4_10000 [Paenibacillus sp. J31TS4]|uniref:MerR family transcriptional regulator n=1 Tax=Paenibacillus sp. J31TS4 TaxID=2807195 RepID=UPI001B11D0BE|nr:MerR family transcriptional regulator [Paenibacillus sp. J31TS4]GIP37720.1 hypothetical protein J31TS4_10000 [Paenibacillus sp. J31TS4]